MRAVLAAAFLTLPLVACGSKEVIAPIAANLQEGPREVVAVLSYADWCSSCKTLDPRIAAVKDAHAFEKVTFVTLDYTEKDKDAFFAEAEAVGVGKAIQDRFGEEIFTGRMVLIDPQSQEQLGEVDKSMDAPAIYAALIAATLEG